MSTPEWIEAYTRKVLTLNGVGDILLGIILILRPDILGNMMGFIYSNEIGYLAGGWGGRYSNPRTHPYLRDEALR
ncbi:MAG: hypothetical protein V1710_02025 [Candidatus Bathyarchaeota archaeon]